MRIALVGNQDNNAYRLCKWMREAGAKADLYMMNQERGPRSRPELIDPELQGSYPSWIRPYDDTGRLSFLWRSKLAREIEREYEIVLTSGATGLMAVNHFRRVPVAHLSLGSEVRDFPLLASRFWVSPGWRVASLLCRKALRKVRKVFIGFRLTMASLVRQRLAHKAVYWGFPEDAGGNRKRVDSELLTELNERYSAYGRVFFWPTRVDFKRKGAEKFLDAYERLLQTDQPPNVLAIVGRHGEDIGAFEKRVRQRGLSDRVQYVPHMPYWKLLTHMSIRNAVVCGILDPMRGNLPGTAREALSVGAVMIRSLDEELVGQCFGPGCPILAADDAKSCFEAMRRVAAMDEAEFARLQKAHMDWAGRYLHYERNVARMLQMLRQIVQADGAGEDVPTTDAKEGRTDR